MQQRPPEHNELQRVAAMCETIKVVVSYAFKVNVLGINAILLAKKFGEAARGFGVISNELRVFGRELREQMQALKAGSVQMVALATRQLKLGRQLLLMKQAGASNTACARMSKTLELQQGELAELQQQLNAMLVQMSALAEAAHQSCLFGVVIARSARIEAAHSGEAGQVLANTSAEFAMHVDQVLPNLERLQLTLGRQL